MLVQFSIPVRNARADAFESVIGASALIKIFGDDGSGIPANCAAADDSATVLATVTCPADWMDDAAAGAIAKLGTWQDASADASGTADHWRLYESTGTTCHGQGDITNQAGTGSMKVVDTSFTATLPFTILTFGWTEGNA